MKGFAVLLSGCALAVVVLATPMHADGTQAFTSAGTTPSDSVLMFRKYRGDDEVEDRERSGRGSGGGGGHDSGGGGRGGSDQPAKNSGGGGKDHGSSGGGKKAGGGNSRDGGDRFGN